MSRKLRTKLALDELYCVYCKARRDGENLEVVNIRNYKRGLVPALQGDCEVCGTHLTKFLTEKQAVRLENQLDD